MQLTEIAGAEAILSRIDRNQLEMASKRFDYLIFVTVCRFLCQEKSRKYYYVVIPKGTVVSVRSNGLLDLRGDDGSVVTAFIGLAMKKTGRCQLLE